MQTLSKYTAYLTSPSRERSAPLLYLPYLLLAFGMLILTVVASGILWNYPYDGIQWQRPGSGVIIVDPTGPAALAGVTSEDLLLAINGIPADQLRSIYQGKPLGSEIALTLVRGGQQLTIDVPLAKAPLHVRISRLEPLLIGVVFWIVGLALWFLRPFHTMTRVFFALSQITAGMFASGDLSTIGWPGSSLMFNICLLFVAPLAIHFATQFPTPLPQRVRRVLYWLFYGCAGVILVSIGISASLIESGEIVAPLRQIQRSFVALALLVALGLLLRMDRGAPVHTRRRRRLLIVGMVVSLVPLMLLSFLPELLYGSAFVDYNWAFPFLILSPLSFAVAVRQGEFGRYDLIVNRSLVYVTLTTLLLSLYVILFLSLDWLMPVTLWSQPLIAAGLAVLIAALFSPSRARLQSWVDDFFYGGWYHYRVVVRAASAELSKEMSLSRLVERLIALTHTMRFQAAAFLWLEGSTLVPRGSYGFSSETLQQLYISVDDPIIELLHDEARPYSHEQIHRQLAQTTPASDKGHLQHLNEIRLWLPFVRGKKLYGVLVMGERHAETLLDGEDRDILSTLAAQTALAAENVALLEMLRAGLGEVENMRNELAEAQRRLSESQEAERLHLAQDLHDGPVQDLYGIHFQLGPLTEAVQDQEGQARLANVQTMLHQVINALRAICGELRPPSLVPFGLETALRAHAERFQRTYPGLHIEMDLWHDEQTLPEPMRLALFRIYQEALNNILHHAEARHVMIQLRRDASVLRLALTDDGCGFLVPVRWIEFARQGHFGLLGIAERASAIGGQLEVVSKPGKGTTLQVIVPLTADLDGGGSEGTYVE